MTREEKVEVFIKKIFESVKDKPGYVWLNKRDFRIISIKTLQKRLYKALQVIDKYKTEREE